MTDPTGEGRRVVGVTCNRLGGGHQFGSMSCPVCHAPTPAFEAGAEIGDLRAAVAAAEARADAAERRCEVYVGAIEAHRAVPTYQRPTHSTDVRLWSVLTDPEPGREPRPSKMWPGQVTDGSHLTWCGDRDCGDPSHAEPGSPDPQQEGPE